jgi:RecA-family ATPase
MTEAAVLETQAAEIDTGFYLLNANVPAPEWLIENLIVAGTPNLLAGTASMGKSYMALQMAKNILEGEDFLGFKTQGKHRILYYHLEGNRRSTAERVKKYEWKDARNGEDLFLLYGLKLASDPDWKAFQERIQSLKVDFVIIDPLRKILMPRLMDWNDNSRVADFYNKLASVTEATGVTFLLVHHFKKQELKAYQARSVSDEYKRTLASGAMAIVDMAYTRMILSGKSWRQRELYYFGKDVPDKTLKLVHQRNCIWRLRRPYGEDDDDED